MKIGILSCFISLTLAMPAFANELADSMFCTSLSGAYQSLMCNGVTPRTISIVKTSYHLETDIADAVATAVTNDKIAGESCDYGDSSYYASHNKFFRHCLEVVKEHRTFK